MLLPLLLPVLVTARLRPSASTGDGAQNPAASDSFASHYPSATALLPHQFKFLAPAGTPPGDICTEDFRVRTATTSDSDLRSIYNVINAGFSCAQGTEGIRCMVPGKARFDEVSEVANLVGKFKSGVDSEFLVSQYTGASTGVCPEGKEEGDGYASSAAGYGNALVPARTVREFLSPGEVVGTIELQLMVEEAQPERPFFYFALFSVEPVLQGTKAAQGRALFEAGRRWAMEKVAQEPGLRLTSIQAYTVHHRTDCWRVADEEFSRYEKAIRLVMPGKDLDGWDLPENELAGQDPLKLQKQFDELFYPEPVITRTWKSDREGMPPYYRLRKPFNGATSGEKYVYKGYRIIGLADSGLPPGWVTRQSAWIVMEKEF